MKKNIYPTILMFLGAIAICLIFSAQAGAQSVTNPISANSFQQLFTQAMTYVQKIAGTIAVIFIILGGVMYMISAGNKDMSERGKKTLTYALVGLAIVIAAPYFLQDMTLVLTGGSGGSSKLLMVATNVLRLLLSIVGILGIIGMVLGAIWMFTSVGDEERYKQGKSIVVYAILGMVIAAASLIIVRQVMVLVGS